MQIKKNSKKRQKSVDKTNSSCYNPFLSGTPDADKFPDANVAQLVEQLIRNQQVRGSSPLIGSIFRGVAQFGSAFGSGPKGRRFKSCHLDHDHAQDLIQSWAVFLFWKLHRQ